MSRTVVDPVIPDTTLRRTIFIACAIGFVILIATDVRARLRGGPHPSDWLVYASASPLFFTADDPYSHAVTPTNLRYIYPPLFAIAIRPLTMLGAETSGMIWAALSVLFLYGFYREWRLVLSAIVDRVPYWLTAASTLAASIVVVATIQGGQVGLLNLYALVLGLRLVLLGERRAQWWSGGIALVLPAAIKLAPGLAGAMLILQLVVAPAAAAVTEPRRRALAVAAGMATGVALWFFAIPSLFVGWSRNLELLASMLDRVAASRIEIGFEWAQNQGLERSALTLATFARGLGFHASDALANRAALVAGVAFTLVTVSAIVTLSRRGTLLDHVAGFAVACCASLFLSPVTWHHHFTIAIPAMGALPLLLLRDGRDGWARAVLAGFVASVLVYYVSREWSAFPILGIGCAASTLLFCSLMIARWRRPSFAGRVAGSAA